MTGHAFDRDPRGPGVRLIAALAAAAAFCVGVYWLLSAVRPGPGLVSISFLFVLPMAVSAFVAYVSDPFAERTLGFYLRVPLWLMLAAIVVGLAVLREGVICVLMLAPLWITAGLLGAWLTYRLRRRGRSGETAYSIALLALPLVSMQVERALPPSAEFRTVTRVVDVDAPPAAIWPLLKGIPDVGTNEGRWNVTQDVLGVPRPLGAHLVGEGVGARRLARWGDRVRFEERIIGWQPNRVIAWRFLFDPRTSWRFADRHLLPDSAMLRVTDGGYLIAPLAGGRSRLTLSTRYRVRTPVNAYSAWWGERLLGDLEINLLGLVKDRAEAERR